jgi:hypothetical protein
LVIFQGFHILIDFFFHILYSLLNFIHLFFSYSLWTHLIIYSPLFWCQILALVFLVWGH